MDPNEMETEHTGKNIDHEEVFIIESETMQDGFITAEVTVRHDHPVFKGHFPEFPVVPGVMMTGAARFLLERRLKKKLMLTASREIKFLSLLVPEKGKQIRFEIQFAETQDGWDANIILRDMDTILMKMKSTYNEISGENE